MRKYLTPALEMEAFDVEDVITASGKEGDINKDYMGGGSQFEGAPIFVDVN